MIVCSGVGNREDMYTTFGRRRVLIIVTFPYRDDLLEDQILINLGKSLNSLSLESRLESQQLKVNDNETKGPLA